MNNFEIFNSSTMTILAVFDPVTWIILHWGISKVAAMAIVAGGAAVLLVLTLKMVFDWVRKIRLEYRQIKFTKILKEKKVSEYTVTVINIDAHGRVVDGKTIRAKDIDNELKQLADNVIIDKI